MGDLRDLYQEMILDHSRRPRNFRALPGADRAVEGFNPLCGDKVTVFVRLEGERVKEVSFQGAGCAISTASASMMTEKLQGKTAQEALSLFEEFHDLVTGKARKKADAGDLGKLAVFSGVCEFPIRVKCATLAWHALKAALTGAAQSVSTE
jgi:nitrogen fixation NifU-like protein